MSQVRLAIVDDDQLVHVIRVMEQGSTPVRTLCGKENVEGTLAVEADTRVPEARLCRQCGEELQEDEHVPLYPEGWPHAEDPEPPPVYEQLHGAARDQMEDELRRSADVGVRWQAQMEDHLSEVREANTFIRNFSSVLGDAGRSDDVAELKVGLAVANGLAAIALAIANNDVADTLDRLLMNSRTGASIGDILQDLYSATAEGGR